MKVYFDSNVFSYAGTADPHTVAFTRDSRKLLRHARTHAVEGVTSPLAAAELLDCPDRSRRRKSLAWLRTSNIIVLSTDWTEEVDQLARAYRERGAVPAGQKDDAKHLAWASLAMCDVLASWNRKHLIRLRTRLAGSIINLERGLKSIQLEFPTEVNREVEGR